MRIPGFCILDSSSLSPTPTLVFSRRSLPVLSFSNILALGNKSQPGDRLSEKTLDIAIRCQMDFLGCKVNQHLCTDQKLHRLYTCSLATIHQILLDPSNQDS